MALDAGSFKATIETLPNGAELMAWHVQAVEAERTRGIEESRKANAEAQAMRKYKIALERLPGYSKDADLDAYVDALVKAQAKAGDADKAELTLKELTAKLNSLQGDFAKSQTELASERKKAEDMAAQARVKTIKEKLVGALTGKVYGHDFVSETLIATGEVVLGDNGAVEFVDGDKRVDFESGLKRLMEKRPDIVINGQRPGAGTTPPAGGAGKKYTPEQIQGMNRDEVRANLKDIKASLGIKV